ncbi:MAG: polysaccharide deacetylase [Roseburia sp.]|nr:polysaccharide deacetylase [Roseburia sp.]
MGDQVKRILYVVCVCLLGVMMFSEFCKNMQESKSGETTAGAPAASGSPASKAAVKGEAEKTAYLTFDDGPSEVTPEILDTLKKKNVKATFFLIGNEITGEREEIVRREKAEGHCIGVHTYSHKKNEMYCDETAFFEDFNRCSDRIREVTGAAPKLHRFPWGSNNRYVCPIVDDIVQKLQKINVTSFDWNVSGEDSVGRGVPKAVIYRNVAKDLEKYDEPIILLHDSNTMQNTASVLGEVIDLIAEKGYSFGTLAERKEYMFPEQWRR